MNMERTGGLLKQAVPAATHQRAAGWLFTEIALYARTGRKGCQVMPAPFAVYLKGDGGECLLPDITVFCDESMMDEEGCHGAPDWVVEVVSPDSRTEDYGGKLAAYIQAGVREYWALDPERRTIVVYYLETPDVPAVYRFGDSVRSGIFPDLVVDSTPLGELRCRGAGNRVEEAKCRENGKAQEFYGQQGEDADLAQESHGQRGEDADSAQEPHRERGEDADLAQESHGQRGEDAESAQEPHREQVQCTGLTQGSGGQMGMEEVRAYLEEHFGELAASRNKGQVMKAAMGALKGKVDSRTLNEAVAELCRNKTI